MDRSDEARDSCVSSCPLKGERDTDILCHVLCNVRDMAYSLNLETGTYDYLSPSLNDMTGFEVHEFMALGAAGIAQRFHPDDREQYESHFNQITVQAGNLVPVIEYRWRHKDGRYRWYSDSRTLIRDEAGKPVAITGSVRDITEQRRSEAEKKRLEEQLQHAQKMEAIGRLAGGVAHDFNNLLTGIMGYASLLEAAFDGDADQANHVAEILDACGRARDLTMNLLGFARKGAFHRQPIGVRQSFQKVVAVLRETVSRLITFEIDVAPDLPAFEGDQGQVDQILMNLCINAVDAMGEEGVLVLSARTVDVTPPDAAERADPERYVEIVVSDSGSGMAPEVAELAFEPFFTTKSRGEGTGLGLSMVYGAVRNHGGEVSICSEPGRGTSVSLRFPAMTAVSEAAPQRPGKSHKLTGGQGTILLVDDEHSVRGSAAKLLQGMGYGVIEACNGAEAVEIYGEDPERISLVMLDMGMPVMGGAEAFVRLRQTDPGVRIVVFSGFSADDKINGLMRRGATDFLQKPFTVRALADTVARALSGDTSAPGLN